MVCREVICKYCGHRFMWIVDTIEHIKKEDGTIGDIVKCPKCSLNLAVFKGVLEAEPIDLLEDSVKIFKDLRI